MKTLIITLLSLMAGRCLAQYPYPDPDLVRMIKGKTLAIQLIEEETEVEIELNRVLKEVFNDEWTLSPVAYFGPKAFEKLKKNEQEAYFFLDQPDQLSDRIRFDFSYIDGSLEGAIKAASENADPVSKDALRDFTYGDIALDYYDFSLSVFAGKKEEVLTHVTFVNDLLFKHDYLFLCQQLHLLLNSSLSGIMRADYLDHDQNVDVLTQSTFVLLDEFFEPNAASALDKTLEPAYEMLRFSDFQARVLSKSPGMVYFKIVYSYQHNKFMWLMVNAEDGKILSVNECGIYKFSGEYPPTTLIKPRSLQLAYDMDYQLLNDFYNK
jgi:hypothetical protein